MMRSSKYYHSFFLIVFFGCMIASCAHEDVIYKKEYSAEEKEVLAETLLNGCGTDLYYQGTVGEQMLIHEAVKYDPNNAWGQREFGVPYLKRGFAAEAHKFYAKAIEEDPEEWLGYKAYCWLYFYRDYKTALEEIDRFDALTPDFVDYPQSTSVDYMRGICYLQLGDYDNAIKYLDKHIKMELKDVGPKYISSINYLLLGMSYQKQSKHAQADSIYNLGLEHNANASDLHFYKAQNLLLSGNKESAKASLKSAQDWFSKGAKNARPYVEEFYAIYQEDLSALKTKLESP